MSKRKLEPIRLEDLEDAARNSGLDSVLRFQVPKIRDFPSPPELAKTSAPTSTVLTPVDTTAISTPVDTTYDLESTRPQIVSTPVATQEPNKPVVTPVETLPNGAVFLKRNKKRLFRPSRPSDAHTDGEDRLYQFMWERSRRQSADATRIYQGAMSELARAIGRAERNVRPLIESLIRKMSIEITAEADFHTRTPRSYQVFDYTVIGQRRRDRGLIWALKNKGIQLLSEEEARILLASEPVSTPVDTTVSTPVQRPVSTPVTTPVSTGVNTSGLYRRSNSEKGTGEPAPAAVVRAVTDVLGFVDNDAIRTLIAKCRENEPDATDEEIAEFGASVAKQIRRMSGVRSPVGLLIDKAARCFVGEPFANYRRQRRAREEELRKLIEES